MNQIANQLNSIINKELTENIIPVKTANGILVGDVEIITEGSLKNIKQFKRIKYAGIFLNVTAITIANMLAKRADTKRIAAIYNADQLYGKYFIDGQMLRIRYNQAVKHNEAFNIDMLWSRYTERCDRVQSAKLQVEQLIEKRINTLLT